MMSTESGSNFSEHMFSGDHPMRNSINILTCPWAKSGLLLLMVISLSGCGSRPEGPRAAVEPSEISIETSSTEEPVKLEFRIRNIGAKAFNVTHVTASCGCTSADVQTRLILPGKDGVLSAAVSSINSGTTRIAVEVITDIPDQPTLTVFIHNKGTGKVPYFASKPSLITFGTNAKKGDIMPFEVITRETATDKPWINEAHLEFDGIEIQGGYANESPVGNNIVERGYEYQARVSRDLNIGEFRSHVVITGHSDKSHQEIRIPIQGTVLAPVQISPGALFGNFSNFEEIPVYTITFQNTQKTNGFKIEPPALNASRFAIEKLNESNELSTFRLRIVKAFGKELIDELVFQTGMIEMPEIRLPVRLLVRD